MTETIAPRCFNLDLIHSNLPISEESCSRMMVGFFVVFVLFFFKRWKSWLLVYKKSQMLFVD